MKKFSEFTGSRQNNIDLLRLLLAIAVIFSHSYLLTGNPGELFSRLVHGQSTASTFAVAFFFALSGYLVTGSWLRSSDGWSYLRKRCLRIFPGLVVALLVSYLIAAPIGSGQPLAYLQSSEAYRFLLILLPIPIADHSFINNVNHEANGSLWTIPCEFIMYLLVMVVGTVGVLQRRWLVLAGFVATWVAFRGLGRAGVPVDSHLPYFGNLQILLHFLTYFLAGMTLALFADRIPRSPWILAGAMVVLAACQARGLVGVMPIAGLYVLFYFAFSPVGVPHFSRIGDLSYGTYLYAFPIQQLLVLARPGIGALTLFAVATPLALLAAALSWRFVEQPFLALKRKPLFSKTVQLVEASA